MTARPGNLTGYRRRVLVHAELRRRDAALHHAVGGNVPALDAEAPERRLQLGQREAGIEQRAENHVAGGAGETVEIQQLHKSPASRKLNQRPSPRMM